MMDAFEKQVAELKLDRSEWQLVKFGDVAIQQKKNVDRENTELTRYVKGEHMRSEDLHLREWGELTDEYLGPAFIRMFEEGDILYGSRRTYLRKVVLAPFAGITSNTTFVIKANEEIIDKRLLPFVMMSEGFTQHSIRNSKGSVNPYVNWKDLADFEFLLPKIDAQNKIVSLFLSIDENKEISRKLDTSLRNYELVLLKMLQDEISGTESKIGDYVDITNGFAFKGTDITDQETDIILMTPGNFKVQGGFNSNKIKYFLSQVDSNKFVFNDGDLVVTMTDLSKEGNTLGMPAFIPKIKNKKILHNQRLGRVVFKSEIILPEFLFHVLRTDRYRGHILRAATRTTVSHTYPERVLGFKFSCPSIEEQTKWIIRLNEYKNNMELLASKNSRFFNLSKSLINQVF
ncbi:MAG: type I restriction enzyme S subunit [Oleiphilaceae bacterium]|jgi:type I restriction enzyme S subunit